MKISLTLVNANLLGGPSHIVPPAEVTFCPGNPSVESLCTAGFHPPGGAPFPATLRLAWDGAGGLYQVELGTGATDLTSYAALSFRAVVDPADPRSLPVLTGEDAAPLEPPAGEAQMTGAGEPGKGADAPHWSGFTPLSSIRIPLSAFKRVDLSQAVELAFSFDGPDSGAIRLADLEFVAR
jgi:hypothetical protein